MQQAAETAGAVVEGVGLCGLIHSDDVVFFFPPPFFSFLSRTEDQWEQTIEHSVLFQKPA